MTEATDFKIGDRVEYRLGLNPTHLMANKIGTVASVDKARGGRAWVRVAFDGLDGRWAFEPHEVRHALDETASFTTVQIAEKLIEEKQKNLEVMEQILLTLCSQGLVERVGPDTWKATARAKTIEEQERFEALACPWCGRLPLFEVAKWKPAPRRGRPRTFDPEKLRELAERNMKGESMSALAQQEACHRNTLIQAINRFRKECAS